MKETNAYERKFVLKQIARNTGQEGEAIVAAYWLTEATEKEASEFFDSLPNKWIPIPLRYLDKSIKENRDYRVKTERIIQE